MAENDSTTRIELKRPPKHIKDSTNFTTGWFIIYPIMMLVIGGGTVNSIDLLTIFSSSKALNLMSIVSNFYAISLGAWKFFHLDTARVKVSECVSYDDYLDSAKYIAKQLRGSDKAELLNEIGDSRKQAFEVKMRAENYEKTARTLLRASFLFFCLTGCLQVVAIIVA